MSTPYRGPDFDALAAFDPDIAGVLLDDLDRLRGGGLQPEYRDCARQVVADAQALTDGPAAEVRAGVEELVGARPAYPHPTRAV